MAKPWRLRLPHGLRLFCYLVGYVKLCLGYARIHPPRSLDEVLAGNPNDINESLDYGPAARRLREKWGLAYEENLDEHGDPPNA